MLNDLLGTFSPTEKDIKIHELATSYHEKCERYDRTVCTGEKDGVAMPASDWQMVAINKNANKVKHLILTEAERENITALEMQQAISRWHGKVPNNQIKALTK